LSSASISHDHPNFSGSMMATEFAPSAQQFTASPSQYTLFKNYSQQVSPINSGPTTPNNVSPTSPRTALPPHMPSQIRQLRPPKSPLYVPAVLRPTEPPVRRSNKPSPPTPPHSQHGSFDSLDTDRTLGRRSTGDSGKFGLEQGTESGWAGKDFGKVTALPTREHWKEDAKSAICDEATCTRYFTYFTRRHHCRRCGNIFCDEHSRYVIPLDQDASYHPQGTRVRACAFCWSEYKGWEVARWSRSNSESSEPSLHTPTTPNVNCKAGGAMSSVFGAKKDGTPESVSASVPRDWNWSTF